MAHVRRNIFTALHLFQAYDKFDLPQIAGIEFLARWALMIQAAVRRQPRAPNFEGLEAYLSHSIDESGGVITSDFTKYVAEEQKAEAQVMKQNRLLREEHTADDKRRKFQEDNRSRDFESKKEREKRLKREKTEKQRADKAAGAKGSGDE